MKRTIFTTILAFILSFSAFAQTEKPPCPTIEVTGGGVVRPDEPMSFEVKTGDAANSLKLEFEWTVSEGRIIEGQNGPSIRIDTAGLSGQNITATVKIKGLPENCANTASEVGSVEQKIPQEVLDEYGKLPNDEVKARMDALFVYLGNEPNGLGYIINYGTDEEIAVREKQIRKAIVFRKYDISRIKMVRCGANPNGAGVWTKVWIIFPSAKISC